MIYTVCRVHNKNCTEQYQNHVTLKPLLKITHFTVQNTQKPLFTEKKLVKQKGRHKFICLSLEYEGIIFVLKIPPNPTSVYATD